ncbi:molybdopterin dinucleotide binding domain-containing protein, partial [Singulisphaera rosea]
FILLTGRGSASQWHTQTRTSKSDVLRKLYPTQPHLEIGPADAARLGIVPEEWVVIESRRGRVYAKAFVAPTIPPGCVFLPMHDEATNRLTFASFDPYSRQPSYKACAVKVVPARAARSEVLAERSPASQTALDTSPTGASSR